MYPDERSLVDKFKDLPFAIVGVNSDENLERLRPVLESEQITWRSFQNDDMDSADSISHRWNVSGWPSTFLIDAQGRIRPHSRQNLEESIRELIDAGSLARASPATESLLPHQWHRRRVWCEPTERLAYVGPPLRRRTSAASRESCQ